MKTFVTLLLCLFPVSLFAQMNDEVHQAMDNYDYETVISLIAPNSQDSASVVTRVQALKAMNRYNEAIMELNSLLTPDSTNTKILIDLAECYKLTGNSRKAAGCYRKASEQQPENKYFRLQNIRSLLAAEDYEAARTACHGWLERDTCSATGFKFLGQAYEGMQDLSSAFFSYNAAYRRDSLDDQTVARIANIFNNNNQFADAVMVSERYLLTDTTSIDVIRQNAKAYCLTGDYKKAIERYESLKRLGDRSFMTYFYLGVSYYGDNWFYGSYENLLEAYRLNPTDVNLLYYFGKSAARTSWKKEGAEYMEEAVRIATPADSLLIRLQKGLIECYKYSGETSKKIAAMEKLYQMNRDYKLFYQIANDYDWAKEYKKAVTYYEKYMTLAPKEEREPIYDQDGKLVEDAVTTFQRAERRVNKIKAEDFFKNGAPDDNRPVPIIRRDTIALK